MDNIPGMAAAANSFEARATRVLSELYSRRRDSLKSALDQADKKLSDMVYFGEAKEAWNASLNPAAKQDAVFAKAAQTCLKISAEDLSAAIDGLSQASLMALKKALRAFRGAKGLLKTPRVLRGPRGL